MHDSDNRVVWVEFKAKLSKALVYQKVGEDVYPWGQCGIESVSKRQGCDWSGVSHGQEPLSAGSVIGIERKFTTAYQVMFHINNGILERMANVLTYWIAIQCTSVMARNVEGRPRHTTPPQFLSS